MTSKTTAAATATTTTTKEETTGTTETSFIQDLPAKRRHQSE